MQALRRTQHYGEAMASTRGQIGRTSPTSHRLESSGITLYIFSFNHFLGIGIRLNKFVLKFGQSSFLFWADLQIWDTTDCPPTIHHLLHIGKATVALVLPLRSPTSVVETSMNCWQSFEMVSPLTTWIAEPSGRHAHLQPRKQLS